MEEGSVPHNAAKLLQKHEPKSEAQGKESPMGVTDEELVTRAQQGDQGAAEDLYNRYQKKAHAIAYHMCGGDWEEARDLTQEAFLRVFRTLKNFRHDASFYTWFYRIVVNACLDSRRRRRRWERFFPFRRFGKQEKERGPNEVEEQAGSGESFDPAGAVSSRQLSQEVRNALIALPEKQQVAFQLKVFEGMSIAEIAKVMGSAKGTVKSHLFRATHSLREALKDWTVS
jgi:RNA polymerase sigma-70 factor (ECF subfamily)